MPVVGSREAGKLSTSGGAAPISIIEVSRPWTMWPAMNRPGVMAVAHSAEPIVNSEA